MGYKDEILDLICRNQNAMVFINSSDRYASYIYLDNMKSAIEVLRKIETFGEEEQEYAYVMIKEKLDFDYVNFTHGTLSNVSVNNKTTR